MTKTLILVVDRDDDFGVKANVETPLIGIKDATSAAIALGIADPEDSDVNALLAAMNIYEELVAEGKDVEISLICGDQKVGHKSDSALVDEISVVIDKVQPDRAILVGDGAEDEYVYPIISSRVPIDSVRKVFVKQAPGLEGAVYIFGKMLSDPGKKKRFLAPIGALLLAIAMVYIIQDIYAYSVTGNYGYIFSLTAPVVVLIIGMLIIMYAYNTVDYLMDYTDEWVTHFRNSNVSITFTLLSAAMVIIGFIIGLYSVKNIFDNGVMLVTLTFLTSILWPIVFAEFFNDMGKVLNEYMEKRKIGRSFMTNTITVFGVAFIIQGLTDFLKSYLGFGLYDGGIVLFEIIIGVMFALVASTMQASYKKYFESKKEQDSDGIQ